MKLDSLLRFTEMLDAFRKVERVLYANGTNRMENDSEHSYHLAMLAWYIADSGKLDLDKNLIIKYALVHDLVEVYAGDTYLYSENREHRESKVDREHQALIRLKEEFPFSEDMFSTIDRYEKREDRESRFIYVLDKMQPIIQIYLDDGRMWKEKGITLQMLFEKKKDKVALSPEIMPYFDELMALLKAEEKELFN